MDETVRGLWSAGTSLFSSSVRIKEKASGNNLQVATHLLTCEGDISEVQTVGSSRDAGTVTEILQVSVGKVVHMDNTL